MEKLTQQEQVRRQKMQDLIDMGIDPFDLAMIVLQIRVLLLHLMETRQKKN